MIADRIKEVREKLNYSQLALEGAGIDQRTLSRWENGDTPRQFDWIAALARRYEASADYLLGLTDDPRPPKRKTLPDGSSALLESYGRMSKLGQDNLLAVARAMEEEDARHRSLQMLGDWIEAVGGEEHLDELIQSLDRLVLSHGDIAAALTELDRLTRE